MPDQSETETPSRRVWTDILIGASVVAWALAAVGVIADSSPEGPHHEVTLALAIAVALTIASAQIITTAINRRSAAKNSIALLAYIDKKHEESGAAIGALCAQVEQVAARLDQLQQGLPSLLEDARWQGYAGKVEDSVIRPFPRNGHSS